MAQQLVAISETTRRAGGWLETRIVELRGQAVAADRAVQEYKARNNIAVIPDEELGPVTMPNVVPQMRGTPGRITHAGPPLGSHNAEIYAGLLGKSDADLEALRAAGVI